MRHPAQRVNIKYFLLLTFLVLSFYPLAGCGSRSAGDRYKEAEDYLGRGEFNEALDRYDFIANNFQTTPYASKSWYRIAYIYGNFLGEERKAINVYYTLISVYPESAEAFSARRDLAGIYSRAGDYTKAVEQYQWLLDNVKDPVEQENYRYIIAEEYFKMNDFMQARAEINELLETAMSENIRARAYFLRANTYYLEGDARMAIRSFEDTISTFPDHDIAVEARFNLAKALEEADRLKEALAVLETLKDEYPSPEAVTASIEWIKKRMRAKKSRRRRR
ncbi:MAG: hypothetical protein BMS9Abin23_0416 [Thermodesulfobacteriota bacterium]|nr:MAG: hypothetical protein BMS9Abin23_0416 [Thermodesulfobacteriota bacterium]